jgi:hypothetical protein
VNTYTTTRQRLPAVSSDDAGHFVVVWESDGQDGSGRGVFGQQFDEVGLPQGGEFLVNSYTTFYQQNPAVARSPGGDFVVVWQSFGQDGSFTGLFAQRYGDLLFADGLESGDLTHWSSASTDGSDLTVGGAAALAGTAQGLSALVNDVNALFVRDDTPSGEPGYVARFYVDPNGFDPGEAANHFRTRLLIAHDQADRRAITLVLRRQVGLFSLQARLRLDTGARTDTGFFPISDDPHFVEFAWQKSSGPGANDGTFVLKIDDVVRSTLTLLDTDLNTIEYVRMGAMSVKSGAGGTLYFDQFVSRRQQAIGPGPP